MKLAKLRAVSDVSLSVWNLCFWADQNGREEGGVPGSSSLCWLGFLCIKGKGNDAEMTGSAER